MKHAESYYGNGSSWVKDGIRQDDEKEHAKENRNQGCDFYISLFFPFLFFSSSFFGKSLQKSFDHDKRATPLSREENINKKPNTHFL